MIYVIGSGREDGSLSKKAAEIISACDIVILKTNKSGAYKAVCGAPHITLDDIYEKSRNFDTLNKNLCRQVLKLSKQYKDTAYIVDGGGYDDVSVQLLYKSAKNIKIIPNTSKADILSSCPSASYTVFSAYDFAYTVYPALDTQLPLVIYEADSAFICAEIKLKLFKFYSEDTRILYYDGNTVENIMLYELDRQSGYSYASSLLLPPQDMLKKKRFTFSDLLFIMRSLRGKGGCPWDREQTHQSIKMNAVEEAYELIEAIDSNDTEAMAEETGDLLLQPVFQSKIAEDMSEFDINDVISSLCKKLIFRHSHIFGSDKAVKAEEALVTWEKNKNIEKSQDTYTKTLKDVAKTFPSLTRAEKVQKRAAKCGFDFSGISQVFDKIYEEIGELKQAISAGGKDEACKEAGDVLFSVVNLLRKLDIDGELALNASTDKFIKRFEYMEKNIVKSGKKLDRCDISEMDKYYTESKEYD